MEQHEIQCIEQRTRKYTKYEYTYNFMYNFTYRFIYTHRSQWPRGLRRSSAAARLLRSWVRIPPGAWMFVCCECRVLSGRGLCDELITRPEEFYRLCWVVVCDLETSRIGAPYIYDISNLRVKLTEQTKRLIMHSHISGTERVQNKMYHSWLHVTNRDFSILTINYDIFPSTLYFLLRGS